MKFDAKIVRNSNPAIRYLIALALFALALSLRFAILPVNAGVPFNTFYPAILIGFYLCGTGPGVLLVLLSGFAGEYFFIPPFGEFNLIDASVIPLSFFFTTSFLIGYFIFNLHRYNDQLTALNTQLIASNEELKKLARTDYLTQVNRRGYFMDQAEIELRRAIRYGGPLSILMLDIDFFKQINDIHGHKTGDAVLIKLAELMRQTLRDVDIIGRIGGEEFAILLPETDIEKSYEAAERLREIILKARVPIESGLPVNFTVSIGVASMASKDDNIDTLLNRADVALYEAKNSGRNKVCVSSST